MTKYRIKKCNVDSDLYYLERKNGWFFWEPLGAGPLALVKKKLIKVQATGNVEPEPYDPKNGPPVFPPCRLISEGIGPMIDIPWWTDEKH